jgi:vacuolar-type H+-ATPase subunit I/STV1
MKKIHWSLVIGIIILALSLGLGAYNYSIFPNSTPVVVKTSFVVTNLFWAAFGLLLILNYFWNKNDSTEVITEDVSYLNKKQNKIFSYYIIVMLIASVDMWVTNNYSSGLNILNLTTIFDLILNLVLAYYVYILFTNKRNVGKELLYVLVVYCATWFFIDL